MILRDLVTRFSFETDESGIAKYNKKLGGMRKGLTRFLGLLGVGLGAKQLFDVGQSAKQAEFSLRRFAGTDFTKLRRQFLQTQKAINSLRKDAGDLVTIKDFDVAAGRFFQTFGRGQRQLDNFGKLWDFAAKQSALTGQNVNTIFDQLQDGIRGGDFGSLLDIPGLDVVRKQLLEFQNQILNPNEPGGRIAILNRTRSILQMLQQAKAEQDKSLTELPEGLIQSRKTVTEFRETFQKLGRTINDLLVPALQNLNIALEVMNKGFGFLEENTGSIKSGVGDFFGYFDPVHLFGSIDPVFRFNQARNYLSENRQAGQSNRPSSQIGPISVVNHITVSDATKTGKEVVAAIDKSVSEEIKRLPITEDR